MKFKIITLGCKVNIYESEIMRELLLQNDYHEVDDSADIIIINTCSVTNMADNKSKKMIRGARRDNKDSIIIVCGCASENHRELLNELDIDILIGNKDKSLIIELINEYKNNKQKIIKFYDNKNLDFESMKVSKFTNKTRAFIKIQDGCDNYCSYCIIPYMRGNIRYKDIDDTYTEVLELANNGHQEIVLTGIHTGSYGRGMDTDLTDLIRSISLIDNLKRIRISSIEITELSDKFLNELKTNPKLCRHMHVPLQAGSNHVLKLMNRKYNTEEYLNIINKLKSIREDISISTDIIVGFPSETDSDFQETITFAKQIGFSKIHVFPYSKREGTQACLIPNHLDNKIKKDRARELISVSNELELAYNNKFINKYVDVLIEEVYDNYSLGHTSNFIKVKINECLNKNEMYNIKIVSVDRDMVLGVNKLENNQ